MFATAEDLAYAVRQYTFAQLRSSASACKAGRCENQSRCFFGVPRHDGERPAPVCANAIVEEKRRLARGAP